MRVVGMYDYNGKSQLKKVQMNCVKQDQNKTRYKHIIIKIMIYRDKWNR